MPVTKTLNPAHNVRSFWPCFDRLVQDCSSVVEFGCGNGANLARIPHAASRLGIEIVPTYPLPRDGVEYRIGDALEEAGKLEDGSYDLVLLIDVIEHLDKPRGILLLRQARRIARKRVLLWVPEGECPQDEEHYDTPDLPYAPSQDHISQWDRIDLARLGFDTAAWDGYHMNRCTGAASVTALFSVWERPSD